ncbi:MAG: MogA/MoaB family molybdenum cofactor biosynthesis protein, partial [Synergistota bacterium]|nr:MogA/MoaB family molybdenum cofactor biosynthesis protein [Synergistota bacterium]
TVSDKGSRGDRKDISGPALEESVISLGAEICFRDMVPDDENMIRDAILGWVGGNGLDLVLVTGGTGLSERDVTPEAVRSLGGREAPGFGEYIRSATSCFNPRAILSRSTAAVFERCLVLALPGSPRGAVECLEAVKPVLRHAIEIASGRGGECGHAHSH